MQNVFRRFISTAITITKVFQTQKAWGVQEFKKKSISGSGSGCPNRKQVVHSMEYGIYENKLNIENFSFSQIRMDMSK